RARGQSHGARAWRASSILRGVGVSFGRDVAAERCYDPAMASNATPESPPQVREEIYDDFDAFLKQAIREYYARGWKSRRGNFIALVMASGQIVSMAADSVKDGSGLKKAALGAASVVALRFGLRYFLS